jgi:hypothetical protein
MRIHPDNIEVSETKLRNLVMNEKERLLDQIYREQPHMLASVLVLQLFGVSMEKMDFAPHILLLIYLSMLASDGTWLLISEDVQDANHLRVSAAMGATASAGPGIVDRAILRFVEAHTELALYQAVTQRLSAWLNEVEAEDWDKYVMWCVFNLVECTSRPAMPEATDQSPGERPR